VTPSAGRWALFLLVIGALLAVGGEWVGTGRPARADHGYLVDTLAGLTTSAFGLAVAVLVLSIVGAEHLGRRSRHEAHTAAGHVVGDLLRATSDLLTTGLTGPDWRARGRRAVDELQRLARDIDDARAAPAGPRIVALRHRWQATVHRPAPGPWRLLDDAWSVMDGDIRTRLMAADDWIPHETARRVRTFIRTPDAVTRATALVGDVDSTEDADEIDRILGTSRDYVERLLVLTVQILDLGELYEPVVDGRVEARTGAALGGLSSVSVGIDLTSSVAAIADAPMREPVAVG
jgi:hypothetical protein